MDIKVDTKTKKRYKKYLPAILAVAASILVIYLLSFLYKTPIERDKNANVTESGVITYEVTTGAGPEVKTGDTVSVHYIGALTDETVFDSSRDRGEPFSFIVGKGQVIPGWEEGILGMQSGGIRRLAIPPELAYGAQGVPGAIPPNAALIFEIELLEIIE